MLLDEQGYFDGLEKVFVLRTKFYLLSSTSFFYMKLRSSIIIALASYLMLASFLYVIDCYAVAAIASLRRSNLTLLDKSHHTFLIIFNANNVKYAV